MFLKRCPFHGLEELSQCPASPLPLAAIQINSSDPQLTWTLTSMPMSLWLSTEQ